jgi:hypothetical protein
MYELMVSVGQPELSVGTPVEVRDRFRAEWSSGFEIAAATPDAYQIRRISDAYVLPVEFDAVDLRLAEARW